MTKDQTLLEDYITGRLTEKQKQLVRDRCLVDPDFAADLQVEQRIYKVVGDQAAQTFLNTTKEVVDQVKSPIVRKIDKKAISWLIAVTVAILAGIYFFLNASKATNSTQLYAEFFEAYPMVLSQRGSEEQRFQHLINAYDQAEWSVVEQELAKLSAIDLPMPLQDLYGAIALMEQNKADQAVGLLKKYLSNPTDNLYQHTLEWYLALAYLKTGDSSNTKSILQDLNKKVESTRLRNHILSLQERL